MTNKEFTNVITSLSEILAMISVLYDQFDSNSPNKNTLELCRETLYETITNLIEDRFKDTI